MPIYTYTCGNCGLTMDIRSSVGARDREWGCGCGGVAQRVFTPTSQIMISAHFQYTRGYHLPDKEDKEAISRIGDTKGSQNHMPRTETFREFMDRGG